MRRFKRIFKRLYSIIRTTEMKILPGNIAFSLFLSIIPIITLIGLLGSLLSVSTDTIINFMNNYFPKEVSTILVPYFNGQGLNINVVIFMIMGFMVASNGANSIIIASNSLYNITDDNDIKRRIKAYNMTTLLVLLIIFMLAFLAFGNSIMNFLTSNVFESEKQYIYYLYLLIKWPIAFIFIFLLIKLIYTMAPSSRIPSKQVNRGAVFTTIGWSILTFIFGYYVTYIANYNRFYGNLSSIIILMIWVYMISYILVIGIAINISTYTEELPKITNDNK